MPGKIKQELDKWEDRSKKTLQKIQELPEKAGKEIRGEYRELVDEGRKLVTQIDNRLDKAEEKTKDTLIKLRKRAQKTIKELTDTWTEAVDEPEPILE